MLKTLLASAGYFLLVALLPFVVAAFALYRYLLRPAFAHFLLRPRHSVRGWCAVATPVRP